MSSPTFEITPKAVRAGAGAGKTHDLTHQVLRFANAFRQTHQRWPRVVVTTFTRKATQELSERLVQLAMEKDPQALEFVSSSRFLQVSTIHGVFDRLLKDRGHLLGLRSDFGYLKTGETVYLAKKTLMELSKSPDYGVLFSLFSFSQLNDLMLESLKSDLVGYRPVNREDLESLLRERLRSLQIRVEQFCARAQGLEIHPKVDVYVLHLQQVASLLILEKWRSGRVQVLELLQSMNLSGVRLKKDSPHGALYEDFKALREDLKDIQDSRYELDGFEHLAKLNAAFDLLRAAFQHEFEFNKKMKNKIEMADLEHWSLSLVRSHPDEVIAHGQDVDYWLVDEFQDTSPTQLEILETLIQRKPFYVVGDPQQSIYLFRGARSEVFRDKVEEIKKSGGAYDVLDFNYRSTAPLLALINRLSKQLGESFEAMRPKRVDSSFSREAGTFTILDETDDAYMQEFGEHEVIYKQMLDLRARGVAFEDVAVLVRKNDQLESLGQFLNQRGLPVQLHSSGLFWRRREVADALSLLKFLINPYDDANLIHLLRSPLIAVSDQDMADVPSRRSKSLWECLRSGLEQGAYGQSGKKLFENYQNRHHWGLTLAFVRSLESLGFFDMHLKYDGTGRAEGNLWKFVGLLKNFEQERGANLVRFVKECERARELEKSVDSPGSVEPQKINIMTVHGSKGLQFDHVFLPFLADSPSRDKKLSFAIDEVDKRWSIRAPFDETETKSSGSLFEEHVLEYRNRLGLQEHLRVLYVAYTRARQGLYLSWREPVKPQSWAESLRGLNLSPGVHSDADFDYIVNRVDQCEPGVAMATAAVSESVRAPYSGRRLSPSVDQIPKSYSVTQMIDKPVSVSSKESFIRKYQGILFHKLLEIIKYPTEKNLTELVSEWFPEGTEDVGEALNYLLALGDPPLVDLIRDGHVEWSFSTRKKLPQTEDPLHLEGQVDLWGIKEGVLWVVDYKSGSRVLKEKAFQQLRVYASALRDHLEWTGPVQLAVIYPFMKKTHSDVMKPEDFLF